MEKPRPPIEPKPPREGAKMEKVRGAGVGAATFGMATDDESLEAVDGAAYGISPPRPDHHDERPDGPEPVKIHACDRPPEPVIVPVDRLA